MIDTTDSTLDHSAITVCPFCHSDASICLHKIRFPGYRQDHAINYCQCQDCGLLYHAPRLSDVAIQHLYNDNYYIFHRSIADECRRARECYNRTVRLLRTQHPGRALEIGCARGFLLALLQKLGWQTQGVELSTTAANRARQYFNLDITTGTIEQFASGHTESFDLILAIDVIEHVPDPAAFIQAAASCLCDNGIMIIDTPNAGSANIPKLGSNWNGFNPFHIHLFNAEHLTQLAKQAGLVIEQLFSYHNALATQPACQAKWKSWPGVNLIRTARRQFRSWLQTQQEKAFHPQAAIEAIIRKTLTQPDYGHTSDARLPLALDNSGDNLILIAKKSSHHLTEPIHDRL